MDLSDQKLGFCLLIKSDGNGLYATKDLELAYQKFAQYQLDANYYIVDIRQAYHFDQVFAVLKKLGMPQADKCHHLAYEFVELPSGAMSSRKGNVITGMSLISQMEQTITANYLEKYRHLWSDEEIATTARMVSNGAIKYGMLKIDIGKKIVFAMDEWLRLDGETGPYLQYVHARIRSLEQKLGPLSAIIDWQQLVCPQESALLWKIGQFNDVMVAASMSFKPGTLCSYLFDLGKLFNSFYAECPIAAAPGPQLRAARLALAITTGRVMKQGLACLGIPAPERM